MKIKVDETIRLPFSDKDLKAVGCGECGRAMFDIDVDTLTNRDLRFLNWLRVRLIANTGSTICRDCKKQKEVLAQAVSPSPKGVGVHGVMPMPFPFHEILRLRGN